MPDSSAEKKVRPNIAYVIDAFKDNENKVSDIEKDKVTINLFESFLNFDNKAGLNSDQIESFIKMKKEGLDIELIGKFLNNTTDRNLKHKYGNLFFAFTLIFTIISYVVIILNAVIKFNIPDYAITALIVEIPIQFLLILRLIALNLFPKK